MLSSDLTRKQCVFFLLIAGVLAFFLPSVYLYHFDQGRYFGVAWYSYQHHHFWWPFLPNGQIYLEKPPLLFWLYDLGWFVSGVNIAWPKLLNVAVLSGCIAAGSYLVQQALPEERRASARYAAPMILATSFFIFPRVLAFRFDNLLLLWTVLSWIATYHFIQEKKGALSWLAFYITLGALTKGAAPLISIAPGLLYACFLRREAKAFGQVVCAVLLPLLLVGAYVVLAARGEGLDLHYLLVGQISGRVGFLHHKFYGRMLVLPILFLLPWIACRPACRGGYRALPANNAILKLLLINAGVSFIFFFVFSSAFHPRYLVPIVFSLGVVLIVGLLAKDEIIRSAFAWGWGLISASVVLIALAGYHLLYYQVQPSMYPETWGLWASAALTFLLGLFLPRTKASPVLKISVIQLALLSFLILFTQAITIGANGFRELETVLSGHHWSPTLLQTKNKKEVGYSHLVDAMGLSYFLSRAGGEIKKAHYHQSIPNADARWILWGNVKKKSTRVVKILRRQRRVKRPALFGPVPSDVLRLRVEMRPFSKPSS